MFTCQAKLLPIFHSSVQRTHAWVEGGSAEVPSSRTVLCGGSVSCEHVGMPDSHACCDLYHTRDIGEEGIVRTNNT